MRAPVLPLCGAILGVCGVAAAQPYAWIPGSSADIPETGNRMTIVDLGAEQILGPQEGFPFTTEPGGADPLVPTFSPDGRIAYVLVGGDEAKLNLNPPEPPEGFLYLFDTESVISTLRTGGSVVPGDRLQRLVFHLPEGRDNAIEPVGQAMSPMGTRLVVTEAAYENVYVIGVNPSTGLLDGGAITVIPAGGNPSPPWINNAGTRAYFCTQMVVDESGQKLEDPKIKILDISGSPAQLIGEFAVPSPPQAPSPIPGVPLQTIPFASCMFPQAPGTDLTIVQPPGVESPNDSLLYIYSGYVGFKGSAEISFPFPSTIPFRVTDPFRIYTLDTATGTLTNGGNPIHSEATIQPQSDQVILSPFAHPYVVNAAQPPLISAGSSVVIFPAGNHENLKPDDQSLLLGFGMLDANGNDLYFGSLQEIDGNAVIDGQGLKLKDGPSKIYRHSTSNARQTTTLTPLATIDRSFTSVVGFANGKVVFGSTNGIFLFPVGDDEDAQETEKSIISLWNPGSSQLNQIVLGLVAGSYAQQPGTSTLPSPTPTVTPIPTPTASPSPTPSPTATGTPTPSPTPLPQDLRELIDKILGLGTTSSDFNSDGLIDAADIVAWAFLPG